MDDIFEFEVIRMKDEIAQSPLGDNRYLEDIKSMVRSVLYLGSHQKVEAEHLPTRFLYASDAHVVLVKVFGNMSALGRGCKKLIEKFGDRLQNQFNAWLLVRPSSFRFSSTFDFKLQSGHAWDLGSMSFGCVVEMNQFVTHWAPTLDAFTAFNITFYHDKRRLFIYLHQWGNDVYHFQVDYSSIHSILLSKENGQWTIYLNFKHPPLLYQNANRNKDDIKAKEEDNAAEVSHQRHIYTKRVIRMPQLPTAAIIARCTTLKLTFKPMHSTDYDEMNYWTRVWKSVRNMQRLAENTINIYFCGIQQATNSLVGNTCLDLWNAIFPQQLANLSFNIRYALHCAVMVNYKFLDELHHKKAIAQFIIRLQACAAKEPKATELALYDLFNAVDSNEPVNALQAFEHLYRRRVEEKKIPTIFDDDEAKNFAEVRRGIMTPSRMVFLPPIKCLRSRFLRNYDQDYALRLYIRDENMNNVGFTVTGRPSDVNEFLREFLVNGLIAGVQLLDRTYEYLGSSTSQLRDAGMYLYARDKNGKVGSTIRTEIGDLKGIKVPAKYVARVGLAFSQPQGSVPRIPRSFVARGRDITTHNASNPPKASEMFSDGVGTISKPLAQQLADAIGKEKTIPSAFQIRYAGCKGMLTLDPRLRGDQIIVRDSMVKFESLSESLEILKVSEARYAYLNQPFINLLNQQGISSNVFLRMQLRCLNQIAKAFRCNCRAVHLLQRVNHNLKLSLHALINSGVDILAEPFFRGMLDLSSKNMIANLKLKARIPLDHNLARNLLGVMDETFTLEYGQIFIQYSVEGDDKSLKTKEILKGDILVTKFPCIHPGDIRKLRAVDVPALHHLVDVIVFPAKGPRPHPNEMAGSDLDGDEYLAIWDPTLIPPGQNYPAMIYPEASPPYSVREVTVEDILKFYCEYVKDTGVGQISNSHLSLSDQDAAGAFCNPALQLAWKSAKALDYAKTGEKVNLSIEERPNKYPDFMRKLDHKPSYQSTRALGLLYRQVLVFEQTLDTATNIEELHEHNLAIEIPGWQKYESDARDAYVMYKGLIGAIQREFGIEEELALLSDSYTKTLKYICGREDKEDTRQLISRFIGNVFKKMNARFHSDFEGMSQFDKERSPDYQKKASAWYCVTRDMNANNPTDAYYGLPWTISSDLAQIVAFRNPDLQNRRCDHQVSLKSSPNIFPGSLLGDVTKVIAKWWENVEEDGHLSAAAEKTSAVMYQCERFVNQCVTEVMRKDYAKPLGVQVASVFKMIIDKLKVELASNQPTSEVRSMLAISATMALYRLYRTRDIESVTRSSEIGEKLDVLVICLSQTRMSMRSWIDRHGNIFLNTLRSILVTDLSELVVKHHDGSNPNISYSLVTAIADKKTLFKLRNAMLRESFYRAIQSADPYSVFD